MKLGQYLKQKGLTQAKFAEMVEVTRPLITQIIGGIKNPSLFLAKRIEKATNGLVTTDDLLNPEAPSRLRKKKPIEKVKK
jgi:transcriptional regulator with XRE-family HTH domain